MELKKKIQNRAFELGFSFVGFSKSGFLEKEASHLENWLKEGRHGEMQYMENHFDKRLNPNLLVDGAKTVISLLFNYYTDKKQEDPTAPKISMYAYGTDYHFVVKEKLFELESFVREEVGDIQSRVFVDSAPVLDKAWAKKSGLGWIGKNGNLINKQQGSYFFVAEIILDVDFEPDGPIKDYCGTCTRCIDACPTEAIVAPYVVDGSKCISYLTIELKDVIPQEFKNKMDNWMFGCDVCQLVCPWNRFSLQHTESQFNPHSNLLELTRQAWVELDQPQFNELFKKSAVKRTKFNGLKRNISFLTD